jgi:quercetin dioxygenase-like cupin family protein
MRGDWLAASIAQPVSLQRYGQDHVCSIHGALRSRNTVMKPDFFHIQTAGIPIAIPSIGLSMQVRIPSASTGGALTLIETTNAPGYGQPVHRHRETEVFHVLQGHYLFEVDGKRFTASTGDTVVVPGGAVHGFVNIDDEPSKQLVLISPGLDATEFFNELGRLMAHGKVDANARREFSERWGVDFLGPPLRRPLDARESDSRRSVLHGNYPALHADRASSRPL